MQHAVVADKAMLWRTTWLRTERQEDSTRKAGIPAGGVNTGRSQSPNSTDHGEAGLVEPWRSASEQKAHQGSGAGRLIAEIQQGADT